MNTKGNFANLYFLVRGHKGGFCKFYHFTKDYKGGFVAAEVLGEILYEKSFIFGEVLAVAGTDGNIRFINLLEELSNHPKGNQLQG